MERDFEKDRLEAIDACEQALYSLNEAMKDLKSAKRWGTFDMFAGNILISTVKHLKMNNAQKYIDAAKIAVTVLNMKLKDMDIKKMQKQKLQKVQTQFDIDISTLDYLGDFVFDGFIMDYMVQGKIKASIEKVQEAINRIEHLREELKGI